jgi:hypothetical protein
MPKNTVPSTAIPVALPSCWFALSTPEAEPTMGSSTPASTMSKNSVISTTAADDGRGRAGAVHVRARPDRARPRIARIPPRAMTRPPSWMMRRL